MLIFSQLGKRYSAGALLAAIALLAIAANQTVADEEPKSATAGANPFAAHNAYPWRLYGKDRFTRALRAGLKHVEVDITYDPQRKAVVATHDARPTGEETELGDLLEPLWAAWGASPDDGYTLIIDLKTSSPELVRGLQAILEPQASLLSQLPKAGEEFVPGKITVCLTGSGDAHQEYERLIPKDGRYLAFADLGFGETSWREQVADYVPAQAPNFTRFLTFEFHNFMDAPRTNGVEHVSLERLQDVVRAADALGYKIRIYTINPPRRGEGYDTRFWDLCTQAGVHMIATDAYEPAREYWNQRSGAVTK